jgi:hypothetical protein
MSALGQRRSNMPQLQKPLIGVADSSVDAVDAPDASTNPITIPSTSSSSSGTASSGVHGSYVGIDIPYGDGVDGDVKRIRTGSREMVVTPSTTALQPYSRVAALFPSDALTDPIYWSPFVNVVRSRPELEEHSYLPGGDMKRAPISPLAMLPGAESFAVPTDGARIGEPPLPFTLAHRAVLITATDKIDYTTKIRILAQSFNLDRADTEKYLGMILVSYIDMHRIVDVRVLMM